MRIEIASTVPSRLRGLLKRRGFHDALLLVPCNDVHTFGMEDAIDVAFIARNGEVVESYRSVMPRRRLRCKQARATIERFSTDEPWFKQGDRVDSGILKERTTGKGVYLSRRLPEWR